ncbi:unnamed protein product [Vitrella brassicaformis CCMP3155]|uniref:Uncharacterized protein n=2 Tax=Vitrella brassicaformis TaxID=1169539 RepID=A0A0G4GCG1_VITBC|nr:unnamed protein product [Vitrella brassicaformis CCMP3155]|eukprot:CEM26998.1 unnamed protein product [Vitrella brassicaformis CCMP3155]
MWGICLLQIASSHENPAPTRLSFCLSMNPTVARAPLLLTFASEARHPSRRAQHFTAPTGDGRHPSHYRPQQAAEPVEAREADVAVALEDDDDTGLLPKGYYDDEGVQDYYFCQTEKRIVGETRVAADVYGLCCVSCLGGFEVSPIGKAIGMHPVASFCLAALAVAIQLAFLTVLDINVWNVLVSTLGDMEITSEDLRRIREAFDQLIEAQTVHLTEQDYPIDDLICSIAGVVVLMLVLGPDIRERVKCLELTGCMAFPLTETMWADYELRMSHPTWRPLLPHRTRSIIEKSAGYFYLYLAALANFTGFCMDFYLEAM